MNPFFNPLISVYNLRCGDTLFDKTVRGWSITREDVSLSRNLRAEIATVRFTDGSEDRIVLLSGKVIDEPNELAWSRELH